MATESLLQRLRKAGAIKNVNFLSESSLFNEKDETPTEVPIINLALSGSVDGGLRSGLTTIAGPSKHYKSLLGLLMVKSYLKAHDDSLCLFYDSEFGITKEYVENNNIDPSRIIHIPVENIEQLKFDISKRLENISRGDKVIVFIDSVGNLASKKEIEDALDEKSVADMTRAKSLKSLFRIITPHFTTKNIPCVVINHTYQEMALFPKQIMSGGCVIAGTKVTMADGSLKDIEAIRPLDRVKTLYGDDYVTYTWNPDTLAVGYAKCYEVTFEDGFSVVCSADHKFLVSGQWVEAKFLQPGVCVTKVDKNENFFITGVRDVGKFPVYDISVNNAEHYVLQNGVISHNTGGMYSSNQIFFIGKSQEKESGELTGWNFSINVEKSRFVREKSKFTFTVKYGEGIDVWSGLLPLALDVGAVVKPSNGWYSRVDLETGEVEQKKFREKETSSADFWNPLLTNQKFKEALRSLFSLSTTSQNAVVQAE